MRRHRILLGDPMFTSAKSIIEWLDYCFENSFFVKFRGGFASSNAEMDRSNTFPRDSLSNYHGR